MFEQEINKRLDALNISRDVDLYKYNNLLEIYAENESKYGSRAAYTSLGRTITYQELGSYSDAFASYLQNHTNLKEGDRIAIQLPNIIQYPVAVLGCMKAGLIVVNTNPLYTERELEHQFNDAGAKALLVLANVADTAAKVVAHTGVETVIVTELADLHPVPKRQLLNFAVKYVKKMVPNFNIPGAVRFTDVMKKGSHKKPTIAKPSYDDVAVLQYTGGTTGVAKGAMLTHGNLIANTLQSTPIFDTYGLDDHGEIVVQPLPLYHIYAFTVGLIVMCKGAHTVLIPNPRDLPALVGELKKWEFSGFCGLNTLFVALCNNDEFQQIDFSNLKMTLSGGMALTKYAADLWHTVTGTHIYEGYGLTETSPVVSVNSGNGMRVGTIGVPVPKTEVDIRDDDGKSVGLNERGELCVKGPQVMKGYWQREEATAESIKDGWFYTGDVAVMDDQGYLKIVDRKKDMILVSGFNVYPNEVEDVATGHPGVLECAAIGDNDEHSGEVVHLYAVKKDPQVTEREIIDYCREELAAYKVPKRVFFRDELPKTNVGKILRRKVREQAAGE
ncbi:Long-chain-fatty-acid--CoA ligase [BD1-7 clade bacterium]|nr:Long-chain-fatty-acid--CoA ligase [BD1-7 clade bacterium]